MIAWCSLWRWGRSFTYVPPPLYIHVPQLSILINDITQQPTLRSPLLAEPGVPTCLAWTPFVLTCSEGFPWRESLR